VKEFVETIARALADHPEQVRVEEVADDRGVTLELSVAPEDLGRLIGREGRTARAIRALLAASPGGERANLKILG
jgi:uncharacterized protein